MKKLVSIITPVYNSAQFLSETIDSVLKQTYKNWELILIDDVSNDNSIEIIKGFIKKDKRIKLITLKKNGGAGIARNVGLSNVNGSYVAFLDSDDVWEQEKLELQLNEMLKNRWDITYTWYWNTDYSGEKKSYFVTPKMITFNKLKFNNYILTSTLMCKLSVIEGVQFSKIRKRQDWIYFLDILKKTGSAYAIEKCLVEYRESDNSLSSNKLQLIKPNLDMIAEYFYNKSRWKALLHFMIFLPVYFENKIFNKKSIIKVKQ